MNACETRGGYEKRGGGGGGGGVVRFRPDTKYGEGGGGGFLSASGPIRKVGGGEGGCLPYDDLYLRLCARVSGELEWGAGGGRQLVPKGGISYEWGGLCWIRGCLSKIYCIFRTG